MKKILLILLVFVASAANAQQNYKKLSVFDIYANPSLYPKSVYGLRSMNDGMHYTTFEHGNIIKYEYETGNVVDTILKTKDLGIGRVSDYEFSKNEDKILLTTERESIYRHSFRAKFYVYDLNTKKLTKVSDRFEKIQLASMSPDAEKVAFVYENNIYIKDLTTGDEIEITFDGKKNKIINGAPDWVYEEEFGFAKAFEWSPDGKYIAYMKFDESDVKEYTLVLYAGKAPHHKEYEVYPGLYTYKYPKAGEDNSIVTVHIYNTENGETVNAEVGDEVDQYIPRIRWTKQAGILAIERLNRLQNKFEILFADATNGKSKVVFTEENKYYIGDETYDNLIFISQNSFVITSERDGYRHLYLFDTNGKLIKQLTSGKWDVTEFIGYDENKQEFYFQAAKESPVQREIYKVNMKGKIKKLTSEKGWNSAVFSKNFKFFINYFTNTKTPTYVTLNSAKGKVIRVLEDNTNYKNTVEEYGKFNKEIFTFKTSEGVELYAYMIKPPNFDPNKKYPVMVTQYSGPNSQSVQDKFSFGWNNLLAQNGIIVACVDPRGTGARGEEFRKITYKQLGKYETTDLIEFAKYLGSQPYIDKNKIAIWGWSYGGFMALSCITKGADYYSTAVAIAPVTNWRYYDNIYTERYMRTPQENPEGYDDNSPINHVDKFKGKLLIIHGLADDNVHFQNTAEFREAMVQAGKQFETMAYTNRNHGIYGGFTRIHLFTKVTDFLFRNLLGKNYEDKQ